MHCLPLSLPVFALILSPICARADSLVLGLDRLSAYQTLGANTTLSQDVQVSANTTIDGIAFFMSDPSGAPVTYSITDLTTGSTLFTKTFDDTTPDPTLTRIAIPEGSRDWVELYLPPLKLDAGSNVYAFSIRGDGALNIGGDPKSSTGQGLEGAGTPEAGLRVWGSSAVAPEPSPLIMLGTGFLALAGVVGRPQRRPR
ncbi:MAG: hypothetical protein ABSF57_09710 [Acidobacteriaceae bacterium]